MDEIHSKFSCQAYLPKYYIFQDSLYWKLSQKIDNCQTAQISDLIFFYLNECSASEGEVVFMCWTESVWIVTYRITTRYPKPKYLLFSHCIKLY